LTQIIGVKRQTDGSGVLIFTLQFIAFLIYSRAPLIDMNLF